MAESEKSNPQMLSAEELRQKALELQLVEMQRDDKVKAREAKNTRSSSMTSSANTSATRNVTLSGASS